MAVTIETDNGPIELSGAATEATLSRLVDKMEKSGLGNTKFVKDTGEKFTKAGKGAKDLVVNLKGLGKEVDDFTDELDDAGKRVGGFKTGLKALVTGTTGAITSVVKFGGQTAGVGLNLKQAGNAIESMMPNLWGLGAAAGALGGAFVAHTANLIDTFDGLSSTGAAFTSNLFELEKVAASSYLSLEQMTGLLRSNSEALSVFGGNTRLGAKRFAEMNQVVQETYRTELSMMGIKAGESAEMLASFTAAQARNTYFGTLSVNQQAQAGANFVKEVQMMANLTGQDRKQLAAKIANDKRRADVELTLSRMTGKAAINARGALATLTTNLGADNPLIDAIRTKFQGLDVAGSTVANMLLSDGSGLGAAIKRIGAGLRDGTMSFAQVQKELDQNAGAFIKQNKASEGAAPYSEIVMDITKVSASLLDNQKRNLVVQTKFNGDYDAFVKSSINEVSGSSKSAKELALMTQDIGKITRLGFNSLTEGAVNAAAPRMVAFVNFVKNNMPTSYSEMIESFDKLKSDGVIALTGATSGLSVAFNKMADWIGRFTGSAVPGATPTTGGANGLNPLKGETGAQKALKIGEKAMGYLSKVATVLSVAGAGYTAYDTYNSSNAKTETGKVVEGGGTGLGALGGGMAGGKIGALIGSFILPGIGTIIGGVLGGIGGSVVGAWAGKNAAKDINNVAGFEHGGVIPTNRPVMVGEAGPELISGAKGATVTPNDKLQPDMTAINKVAESVQALVQVLSANNNNNEMLVELKKFNKHASNMVQRMA
jgi:hypothetical protein